MMIKRLTALLLFQMCILSVWSADGDNTFEPTEKAPIITFADANVKAICVANWDTNGDGELDEDEAAAVTSLGSISPFRENATISSFDEFRYFKGLKAIGLWAFMNCSQLKSIIIPDGVTTIGQKAFMGCSSLASLSIPGNVEEIDANAFRGCSGLKELRFEDSEAKLALNSSSGSESFGECMIETLYIGRPLSHARTTPPFESQQQMSSVVISENVKSLPDYYFRACTSLTSVSLPEGMTSIGKNAFERCSKLEAITIPQSVTSFGIYAFDGCSLLSDCNIPEGVTSVSYGLFNHCNNLRKIVIPSSVTEIGDYAFACDHLVEVTIGNPTVPTAYTYSFTNRANATLYVPAGSKSAYEASGYWNEFKEIREIPNQGTVQDGDVNGDGKVDLSDAIMVTYYSLHVALTSFNETVADMNGDGKVDLSDAIIIIYKSLGVK